MTDVCFFNQQVSDVLQHIAVTFEVSAMYLVWRDYKQRNSDIRRKDRVEFVFGKPTVVLVPSNKRTKEFIFACVIGTIAVCMEFYQLVSQYSGC